MSNPKIPISENDLQSWVDGALDSARRAEVEAFLAENPAEAARLEAYRKQNDALRGLFDPVLHEPLPPRLELQPRRRMGLPPLRYAAAVAWMAIGGLAGWMAHGSGSEKQNYAFNLPRQAAIAHVVYTPEVQHPVEVGADQEGHLVRWLSKRLNADLKVPDLTAAGFSLMGGRLLPGSRGPAAQFMYQDPRGQRLTLYVRTNAQGNQETAFRFAREDNVSVFYWLDGQLGYALSGDIDRNRLLHVAQLVYGQLNP